MIVTEKAHGRTRFFRGASRQFEQEWDAFTADRARAKSMTAAEAKTKSAELNARHAEHSTWCVYGVTP
jgi:hypothetical protein